MFIGKTILGAWIGACSMPLALIIMQLFPDFNPVLLALIGGAWGGVLVASFKGEGLA